MTDMIGKKVKCVNAEFADGFLEKDALYVVCGEHHSGLDYYLHGVNLRWGKSRFVPVEAEQQKKYVKCINSDGLRYITEGKVYEVLEEEDCLYKIKADNGYAAFYTSSFFENVAEPTPLPKETPARNKYSREIIEGVWVDVYDVLRAFNVTDQALGHLVKKALAAGQRGHKDATEDYKDILASAERALEMHLAWNKE